LTPPRREPGEKPELDAYGELISRARESLPLLTTASLVRMRELLERVLEADDGASEEGRAALAELARMLARGA
jgi:hypothetical protein